jgi:hypothetical protein
MADKKISQLTGATTPLAGTEVVPLVQSSTTKKVSVADLTSGRPVAASSLETTGKIGVSVPAADGLALLSNTSVAWAGGNATDGFVWRSTQNDWTHTTLATPATGAGYAARIHTLGTTTSDYILFLSSGAGGGAAKFTVQGDGTATLATGNLVVGTAGKGIDFSANTHAAGKTSELLNWYEEGTWTATLTAFSSAPTTPVTVTAYYTRVGRQITCAFAFKDVDTTGASGPIQITGLPFTPALTDYRGSVQTSGLGATISTLAAYAGSATMELLDATNFANVNITAGTGKYVVGTVTYFV